MLKKVKLKKKFFKDYVPIIGKRESENIYKIAQALKGKRILNVNATEFGGGVAEILSTLVPLMRDLGIRAEWQVIYGDSKFFNITKSFHNGLQGMKINLTEEMKNIWVKYNKKNAKLFEGEYDFVVVHDPQPAGLRYFTKGKEAKFWIWRCHIDLSYPNLEFWKFILPYISVYDAGIFSMEEYLASGLKIPIIKILRPTIDPLSLKNRDLSISEAKKIMKELGVDIKRPFLAQVSRFDYWKDPLGVIDIYRQVKKKIPEIQLVLMGSIVYDDPEGWLSCEKVKKYARGDKDIKIVVSEKKNDQEVNACQRLADIILQNSIREGFGLVVAEALWKKNPVIARNSGGIPLQVIDGKTGFLFKNKKEAVEKILYLISHPEKKKEMGKNAKNHIKKNFLVTRLLKDYLLLFSELLSTRK